MITTTRSGHPCHVRRYLMSVAQAALTVVGNSVRLGGYRVCPPACQPSAGACGTHSARGGRSPVSIGRHEVCRTSRSRLGDQGIRVALPRSPALGLAFSRYVPARAHAFVKPLPGFAVLALCAHEERRNLRRRLPGPASPARRKSDRRGARWSGRLIARAAAPGCRQPHIPSSLGF